LGLDLKGSPVVAARCFPFTLRAELASKVDIFSVTDFFERPGIFLIVWGEVFGTGSGDVLGLSFATRGNLTLAGVTFVSFWGDMMKIEA